MTDVTAEPGAETDADIEAAKVTFAAYLEANTGTTITKVLNAAGASQLHIGHPWSDKSLALVIPPEPDDLAEALHNCILPYRLLAIYHVDKRALEVIWTAFPLSASMSDVSGRKFTFTHKRRKHVCHFTKSSKRLLTIATASKPISESNASNFRNLASFARWNTTKPDDRALRGLAEPLSFWISNVKWSDEGVISLVNSLNFYLTYYDEASPYAVVLPPLDVDQSETAKKNRYVVGSFPAEINGSDLDQNLLSFWTASLVGNPAMKFILYYRIVEYASHHFLDEQIRRDVKRYVQKPDFYANLDQSLEHIIGICMPSKQDDIPKFKGVLKECVDMSLIWREIEPNIDFFRKETRFEGGFSVGPLLSKDDKKVNFENGGRDKLADCLRLIRNTLSHGRDMKTGKVIMPTARNFRLLMPWVHLVKTAAAEVVIYQGLS